MDPIRMAVGEATNSLFDSCGCAYAGLFFADAKTTDDRPAARAIRG